jgi:GT2 family glycosyltransferase
MDKINDYGVVIVTYNRLDLLRECLDAVLHQTIPFKQIIVVNNCSTDGTKEYLAALSATEKRLNVLNEEVNGGGAAGFYSGLSAISDNLDYVLIIDDDAILNKDFIQRINENIVDDIYAYSGAVSTENKIDTTHRRRLTNTVLMTKKDVPISEYENEYFDYDLSTFCGLIVKRKLISRIGLPRKDFFIWYDDTEYSLRIRKHSKIRNINSARLNHKTTISTNQRLSWKSYYGYRNQWIMGHEYSAFPIIYDLYRIIFHIIKIILCSINAISKPIDKIYYRNLVELHRTVIRDVTKHRDGINKKYMWGTDLNTTTE